MYSITITVTADNWTGAVSTAWESGGNWCGGVPSSNMDVSIPSVTNQPIIGASIKGLCNNITISSGATVTIAAGTSSVTPGGLLTIGRTLTNNAGASGIVVKSSSSGPNGSLIFSQPGLNSSVQATVEMYSLAAYDGAHYKWQFFGIPLHSLASTSPTFDGGYVRQLHENDIPAHWEQLNNASGLTSFTGYEITQAAAKTYVFQGQLENSNYSATLPYSSGVTYPGQSLIGNPYTAAIEISKLAFGSKMLKTVYIYNTGSYNDWQSAGSGTASDSINTNTTAGQYTAVPQAQAGNAGLQHQIPSMQAFLVRAQAYDVMNATLSIPYSSVGTVVGDSIAQRVKGQPVKESSTKVWTTINVKGSRFADKMWIFTEPTCTHSFDNGWDSEKFLGSALSPQLYSMEVDGDYQVNSVDDMNNTYLGFLAGEDSIYTLTFTNENLNGSYAGMYLLDLMDSTITNVLESGTKYTFVAHSTPEPVKRFKIITATNNIISVENPTEKNKEFKIYSSGSNIYIQNFANVNGDCRIYDIAGHYLMKVPYSANNVTIISNSLRPGAYIAVAVTGTEKISKQLIVR